jgi:hypothetical protein
MKMIKMICAMVVVCTATALIAMAGTVPAAVHRDGAARRQAQTETQLPEILPAAAIDFTAIDRIFE